MLGLLLVFSLSPGTGVGAAPVFASDNVAVVGGVPDVGTISTAFGRTSPHMYVSTMEGLHVYDISDPRAPRLVGAQLDVHFENEAVSLGERADGTKIVLVGFDPVGVAPTAPGFGPDQARRSASSSELLVIDVTDPTKPTILARHDALTRTHILDCMDPGCHVAYTSGGTYQGQPAFSVLDLTDPANPKETVLPSTVGTTGHDWDIDAAGVAWHVGRQGTTAYDISDPFQPRVLNSTDANGLYSEANEWNTFIHHNSMRPFADRFKSAKPGRSDRSKSRQPSVHNGNVLLVTEEDYDDPTCAAEGSFQTWHVPDLDPTINPAGTPGAGTITPLDLWNTELADSGIKTPAGAFCSAHYFDVHDSGLVAQGWYQQGMRLLDVRDPRDIKQVGYYVTGAQETFSAQWVPEYDDEGRQTGRKTNLLYTNDPSRGLEILEVTLPETAPEATAAVTAPILPEWLVPNPAAAAAARASDFGAACRIPSTT